MTLSIVLSTSVKNCVWILVVIVWNLWIAFARTLSTKLNRYGESRQPCLVPDFSGIASSLFLLTSLNLDDRRDSIYTVSGRVCPGELIYVPFPGKSMNFDKE
ncbi:hypothetical protein STEG23_020909, partial [Scotinomys teguina]